MSGCDKCLTLGVLAPCDEHAPPWRRPAPATESGGDADHVLDWGPALAMALDDVLPFAVVGVQHHERDRREQAEARLRLATDVLKRYRAATPSGQPDVGTGGTSGREGPP